MTRRRPASLVASAAAFTLIALVAAGCASGSGSDSDGGASDMEAPAPAAEARADAPESALRRDAFDSVDLNSAVDGAGSTLAEDERALISQGNVQLRSDDVGEALFEVQKVVDELAGEISQNETATDDDGLVKRARVVARIPSARFAEAMQSLEEAATLISSSSNIDDVTTKVIDNQLRLEVQKRSIRRIALLLDRAESIRDIVNIEGQLSRRQAQLGSLQRQQAYLADQTQMSTITVSLERTKPKPKPKDEQEDAKGFVAGLDKGWAGFENVVVALATAAGAVLPFLVAFLLLGLPALAIVRRTRRARPTPTEA
ncbi:MAG: DUF4349 domain-containing protein [Nocardioides sp.]|nr:DUF4349 domain-containing protein [Nocardioides sp.]